MSFIWPAMLFSLVLIPLLVVFYVRLQNRRRQLAANFSRLWLREGVQAPGPGWRRHISPLFFLAGLSLLLMALARPQAVVSLPKVEGTVILAFDVSDSMAADDLKPTRMDAAKAAARNFIDKQPIGVQIGVVAFSDNGFSVQVPTYDQTAILAAIDRLEPTRGTSLATGIQASLNTIAGMNAIPTPQFYSNVTPAPTPIPTPLPSGSYSQAVIVLLTDGENNLSPDPLAAAQAAAERGVRIYTVGIGSPAGTTLQVEGFMVHTQLDEALLKQISAVTEGAYYNAGSTEDLLKVYDNIESQLVIKPEKTELTSILAGAGLVILLAGGAFSLIWFGRLP
jgi:Ca-activated chloride channel family protein